jgi:hypothetical protein
MPFANTALRTGALAADFRTPTLCLTTGAVLRETAAFAAGAAELLAERWTVALRARTAGSGERDATPPALLEPTGSAAPEPRMFKGAAP